MTGETTIELGCRSMRNLGLQLSADLRVAASAEWKRLSDEKGPDLAAMGLVAGRALSRGDWRVGPITAGDRVDVMTLTTHRLLSRLEQSIELRPVGHVAARTVSHLEGWVLLDILQLVEQGLVAGAAQLIRVRDEELGSAGVGGVAGRALAIGDGVMENSKTGPQTCIGVALSTKLLLVGHQEPWPTRSVWAMAV